MTLNFESDRQQVTRVISHSGRKLCYGRDYLVPKLGSPRFGVSFHNIQQELNIEKGPRRD